MFTFEGNTYTLADMLATNGDDFDFCVWAIAAKTGDRFMDCECIGTEREALDSAIAELLGE